MKLKISLSNENPVSVSAGSSDALHEEEFARTGRWGREGAGCLCVARDTGRILLCHRSAHVLEPHTFGTYGGAVDNGESPEQCTLREMIEETGYQGKLSDLRHLYTYTDKNSGFKYTNFILAVPHEFHPQNSWEAHGGIWVKYGDWPSPLHPGMEAIIKNTTEKDFKLY